MHRFTRIAALLCVSSILAACGGQGGAIPQNSNGIAQSVHISSTSFRPYFLNLSAPKNMPSMATLRSQAAAGSSIPFFSGSVKSPLDNNTYSYSIVGADPHTSNVTTNVSYVPIVLRVHFPGGIVLDPTKPGCNDTVSVQNRFYQGPNFAKVPLTSNGIKVGKTQINDGDQRALFWTLIYHLEPAKWDDLARSEPIHPDLIAALPTNATTAIDVGAGSGRLTAHLAKRSPDVIAIEPSAGLRSILTRRLPDVHAMDGWAEAIPVEDGWSQLTAACGAFGPDLAVILELARVTARGGCIALINPEHPEWFEASGWQRITAPPMEAPAHPRWIDEFFGPPDPPHEMVLTEVS